MSDTEAVAARLKRIEGQVKGIQRLLEEARPC
ncbi:MAG: metal-sensitive transcriptional regulator [Chloroflexi bacterium]|nr:metal-sensitive transcriptional regulator [Chloroflexota bacterium]